MLFFIMIIQPYFIVISTMIFSQSLAVITLDNINFYDNNFQDCYSNTINHVKLMGWYNRYNQRKASK